MQLRNVCAGVSLLIGLSGCGAGVTAVVPAPVPVPIPSPTPAPPPTPAPTSVMLPYHAFGDSITMGYPLPNPSTQAYPALLAAANSLALTNDGIGGSMSCDVPAIQIFAHGESPSTSAKSLYSILISTNDVAFRGAGPYETNFNLCQQASIAWLALPVEYKTAAPAAILNGASHVETANNWNAVFTDAPGASITFPFLRLKAGAAYVWYRIADGNPGTFSYALDGTVLGTLSTSTIPTLGTFLGTSNSLALLRIPAVSSGVHLLTLTQTSAGTSGMGIVALGLPPLDTIVNTPRVLVGTTPPQNFDGISQCAPSTLPCDLYTADITANVKLIAGDGLDVELFDTGKYFIPHGADFYDNYHPNALGHTEIAHAIQDIY